MMRSIGMYNSHIARRRFLQASAATLAGIAAGAELPLGDLGESASTQLTWLVRSDPVENPWEQKVAIPHFEKMHPGVRVKPLIVTGGSGGNFDVKLSNMVAAGTPPDIWTQWGPRDTV